MVAHTYSLSTWQKKAIEVSSTEGHLQLRSDSEAKWVTQDSAPIKGKKKGGIVK